MLEIASDSPLVHDELNQTGSPFLFIGEKLQKKKTFTSAF